MIISGHEAFLLTLLFAVTGYITHSVVARFGFRRNERTELLLLRFLAYGTVNVLLSLPIIALHTRLLPRETWAAILTQNLPAYYQLAFCVLFLIPALLGILFGLVPYLYDVQTWYRAPVAGWDERVARSRGQWVLISLEGGATAAGFLSRESSVVSETGDRDLYLETLWCADSEGIWRKVPRSQGMLIAGSLIRGIEFWEDEVAKPATFRDRLRAWAAAEGGRTPPNFRSCLNTSSLDTSGLDTSGLDTSGLTPDVSAPKEAAEIATKTGPPSEAGPVSQPHRDAETSSVAGVVPASLVDSRTNGSR